MTRRLADLAPLVGDALSRFTDIVPLVGRTARGYVDFRRTGSTPREAFRAMRDLYCVTNGRSNDVMGAMSGWLHPPPSMSEASGVLGTASRADVARVADNIRLKGYHVFDRRLPDSFQSALVAFALSAPASPLVNRATDGLNDFRFEYLPAQTYDRHHVISAKYVLDAQRVAEQPEVQALLMDASLLGVAGAYLRAEPIHDDMTMWWSTAHLQGKASSAAAQHFHFDMDRVKFLKFFFYLTDVTPETGPHCFVAGSHRRKPRTLLRDSRISDEEMRKYYSEDEIIEITGPSGTIIAADTRGFHKGKPLLSGDRLILEFEFATSLFGADYASIPLNERFTDAFRRAVVENRRRYATFAP